LEEYVGNIERENFLKEKINESEEALIPRPLFVEPLNTVQPTLTLDDILENNKKWKRFI
jgi:hypothetical protein